MPSPHKKTGVDRRIDSFSKKDIRNNHETVVTCDWPGEIVVSNEEVDLVLSFLGKDIQKLLGE